MENKSYQDFLLDKMAISHQTGFKVSLDELTPSLYPHVKDTVRWAIEGGCRAIFSSFGMQKTVTQLEILRIIIKHTGGKALVVCPKRVVVEFVSQARQHLGEVGVALFKYNINNGRYVPFINGYEPAWDNENHLMAAQERKARENEEFSCFDFEDDGEDLPF